MATEATDSARVYRETTISLPAAQSATKIWRSKKLAQQKKPRRDKSDLGENFIAPDGGWAWVVCIAAGVSNLVVYPCLQMFGFMFRERLTGLGLSSPEITTIINTNSAVSSCSGLLNGPMFRRFTYRQVAIAGSCFIFTGLMLTAFCETFLTYMLNYSLLYGFGMGISVSASTLALNTYFKVKRRKAAGFSWAITGLGPIMFPYVVTMLVSIYGVQGTVMMFAAFSLHTIVSSLIYQPVKYHVASLNLAEEQNITTPTEKIICKYCELQQQRSSTAVFSPQYLFEEDNEDKPGYAITAPGTPMLARANDGWYGSRLSLSSNKMNFRKVPSTKDVYESGAYFKTDRKDQAEFYKSNHFKRERDESLGMAHTYSSAQLRCQCREMQQQQLEDLQMAEMQELRNLTLLQKIVVFFDLDLLRDFTYVNLVIGLTIINFGELNFSILTPFILHDFGLDNTQITIAMSLLASLDITMRFLTPFLTEKINLDNRIFFLMAVMGIATGRTIVACTRSYSVILCAFAWIGLFKGVRTVFWPLIIPSFVPLKRLPAATGLQLLITGLFGLVAGPFVGLIRDKYNYSICLHFLNMLSFMAAILWTMEAVLRIYHKPTETSQNEEAEQKLNQK